MFDSNSYDFKRCNEHEILYCSTNEVDNYNLFKKCTTNVVRTIAVYVVYAFLIFFAMFMLLIFYTRLCEYLSYTTLAYCCFTRIFEVLFGCFGTCMSQSRII